MAELPTITISGTAYRVVAQLADTPTHRSFRVEGDGRSYFLKVFRQEAASAFDKQMAALASVKPHAGLSLPTEIGDYNEERFLLREWVEGASFETFTRRFRFNPKLLDEALAVGEQLARAVGKLHEQGTAHGRLKPENVFFDSGGCPVVTDASGTGDPRDDVRQLGLLLCRLYTGKPKLAIHSRTLIELTNAKVPMNLLKVLWQAIQDQPSQRFKDAGTLALALQEVPLEDHKKTVYVRAVPKARGAREGVDPRLKWGLTVVILIAMIGSASYYLRMAPLEQNAVTSSEPEVITPVAPVAIDERLPPPIRTSGWQAVQVWNFRHSPEALSGNAKTGRWHWNETGLVQEDDMQSEQPFRYALPEIELSANKRALAVWYSAETDRQRGIEPGVFHISHILTRDGHLGNKVFGETFDGSLDVVKLAEAQVGQAMLEDTVLLVLQDGYCYTLINDRLVDSLALEPGAGEGFPRAISPELLSIGRSRYHAFGVAMGEPLPFLNSAIEASSLSSLSWSFAGRSSIPLGVEASPRMFAVSAQGLSIVRSGGGNMEMAHLGRIPTAQRFVIRLGVVPGEKLRSDSRGVGIDMNWFVGGQYKANVYIEWKPDEGKMVLGEAYYRGGRWQNTRLAPEQRLQPAAGNRHYILDYYFQGDQVAVAIDGTPAARFAIEVGHPASYANLRLISGYRSTFSRVVVTTPE